jgi:two-component system LytT family sensor kinase
LTWGAPAAIVVSMRTRVSAGVPQVLAIGGAITIVTAVVAMQLLDGPVPATRGHVYVFVMNVLYWSLWTLLAPLALHLGERFRFSRDKAWRPLMVHAAASVLFASGHLVGLTVACEFVRTALLHIPFSLSLAKFSWVTRVRIEWEVTMYWAMIGLAHALAYRAEAQARAVESAGLEGRLAHAQLQALQSQLQPHFLFNTLHAISAMVRRDAEGAELMIERLADLLRMTLKAGAASEVPLRQELAYVEHYLAIERVHMGGRLIVASDVSEDALDGFVPPLLLQPLVENAIRHGLARRAAGGRLELRAWKTEECLELEIADDGVGLPPGARRIGLGLENTRRRLEQLYGDRQRFEIGSRVGGGVSVRITLPYRVSHVLVAHSA